MPQTWEDPLKKTEGYCGDNDPLDLVELSGLVEGSQPGNVWDVKVLGALGLID
jgi:inorganic pyrophosphatase